MICSFKSMLAFLAFGFFLLTVRAFPSQGYPPRPYFVRRPPQYAQLAQDIARISDKASSGSVPPALVLDAGEDNKLFIPLPCESRVCSTLLFKLAELGKIPWHYAQIAQPSDEDTSEPLDAPAFAHLAR